jgi:hypothetical protein
MEAIEYSENNVLVEPDVMVEEEVPVNRLGYAGLSDYIWSFLGVILVVSDTAAGKINALDASAAVALWNPCRCGCDTVV